MKKFRYATFLIAILAAALYLFNPSLIKQGSFNDIHKISQLPSEITRVKKEGISSGSFISAMVVKVIDGDTLDVKYGTKTYKVRLLDVDTPESVKRGVNAQPYGKEASRFMNDIVLNKQVRLIFEKDLKDKYGRLLAHVFIEDGKYLNAMLVRNGFARVEIVKPNTILSNYFLDLQEKAIKEKSGLWGLPEDQRPFIKDSSGEYIPRYWIKKDASGY